MEEIWKEIKDYEGLYEVSNLGRVRRIKDWCGNKNAKKFKPCLRILKPKLNNANKYYLVSLSKNSKVKYVRIHKLVAETFIPNLEGLKCVNHKDGNKLNNRLDNLEWTTYSGNLSHAIKMGLKKYDSISKPVAQYSLSGEKINEYKSIMEAQRQTGINNSLICRCCKGKQNTSGGYVWKYI